MLKQLRQAFAWAQPTEQGFCAIEGVRILEEAIRSGLRFEAVFFRESAENLAQRLLPQMGAHVETLLVRDSLFNTSVPSEAPQGVAALVRWKEYSLDDVLARAQSGPILAIAGLQDPGNLGTILRSAEAFSASGVVSLPGTVSPWNQKAMRASAGSVFRLPSIPAGVDECFARLGEGHIKVLTTVARGGTSADTVDFSPPIALLIGNEGNGVPEEIGARADGAVTIPCPGPVESLNAAVAGSLLLYEASRQRATRRC